MINDWIRWVIHYTYIHRMSQFLCFETVNSILLLAVWFHSKNQRSIIINITRASSRGQGAPVRRRIRCTEASVAEASDGDWRAGCADVADDRGKEWWWQLGDEQYMIEVPSFHRDLAQCVVVPAQRTLELQTSRSFDRLTTIHHTGVTFVWNGGPLHPAFLFPF